MATVPEIRPAVRETPIGMPVAQPMVSARDMAAVPQAIAALGDQLSRLANVGAQIVEQRNVLAAKDAAAKYDSAIVQYENEYQQTRVGGNANKLTQDAELHYKSKRDEITNDLTPAQRRLFDRYADRQTLQAQVRASEFEYKNLLRYDDESDVARIGMAQRNAIADQSDDALTLADSEIWDTIGDRARRFGWSNKHVQLEYSRAIGAVHEGRLAAMMQANNFDGAQQYIDKYGDKIDPVKRADITDNISRGQFSQKVITGIEMAWGTAEMQGKTSFDNLPEMLDWIDKNYSAEPGPSGKSQRELVRDGFITRMHNLERERQMAIKGNAEAISQRFFAMLPDAGSPDAYSQALSLANNSPYPEVRAQMTQQANKMFGPDARRLPDDSFTAVTISENYERAIASGSYGPMTPERRAQLTAQMHADGLSMDVINRTIDGGEKGYGQASYKIRDAQEFLDKHGDPDALMNSPNLWNDVRSYIMSNPNANRADIEQYLARASLTIETDEGLTTLGQLAAGEADPYAGDRFRGEIESMDQASPNEVLRLDQWLKSHPQDKRSPERIIGEWRYLEFMDMRRAARQSQSPTPEMRMPGVDFARDVLPAFDAASTERRSQIREAYNNNIPRDEAVQKYGDAAMQYYARQEWLMTPVGQETLPDPKLPPDAPRTYKENLQHMIHRRGTDRKWDFDPFDMLDIFGL